MLLGNLLVSGVVGRRSFIYMKRNKFYICSDVYNIKIYIHTQVVYIYNVKRNNFLGKFIIEYCCIYTQVIHDTSESII